MITLSLTYPLFEKIKNTIYNIQYHKLLLEIMSFNNQSINNHTWKRLALTFVHVIISIKLLEIMNFNNQFINDHTWKGLALTFVHVIILIKFTWNNEF